MKRFFAFAVAAAFAAPAYGINAFQLPVMNGSDGEVYDSATKTDAVFIVESYQLRCGYCNDNAPKVDELARYFSYEEKVQFLNLGIDRDNRDYQQWIQRHNPSFPVLKDAQRTLWNQLRGSGTPTTWVLNCKHEVKWTHVGSWDEGTREELKGVIDAELAANCQR